MAGGSALPLQAPVCVRFQLAGILLELEADDPAFVEEATAVLGAPTAHPSPSSSFLHAQLRAGDAAQPGRLVLTASDPAQLSPADVMLAVGSADFPFDLLEAVGERVVLARRGETRAALEIDGGGCTFARMDGWRRALAILLLQRLMRLRRDAVFFHAASVALGRVGALLVGPKGAGKSTLALALALRGHALLGDENACYLPATGELVPFLRPVGIKPGPRAAALDAALRRRQRIPERDGMMRVPAEELTVGAPPAPARAGAVVFLQGFSASPELRRIQPGRLDVGRLQPVGSSMVNAPRAQRVFEMARLLTSSRVFELRAGSPDDTAEVVEEALAS